MLENSYTSSSLNLCSMSLQALATRLHTPNLPWRLKGQSLQEYQLVALWPEENHTQSYMQASSGLRGICDSAHTWYN